MSNQHQQAVASAVEFCSTLNTSNAWYAKAILEDIALSLARALNPACGSNNKMLFALMDQVESEIRSY
jgi:sugar (pentulose or hexulose) kinase